MIGSMPTSWPDWDAWTRSRCTRYSTGVRRCGRLGGVTSPGSVGSGADGADQRHARTGEEYGHAAPQEFEPELCTKGRGSDSHRDPRSAAALGAYGGGTE